MRRIGVSAKSLWLGSNVVIAALAWGGSVLAAAQPSPTTSSASTAVIRGSNETTAQPAPADDPPPVVLRGSRLPPAQPPADYGCPAGYLYDPSSGCVVPGYASEPYDYGYWPDWWYDGFGFERRQHRFPHGFAARAGRRPVVRLGHPAVGGFGHGVAHIGGFGAHIGGFGRR